MRKEIEEIKVKTEVEHKDIMSGEGIELVPLMKDKHTGEQRDGGKEMKQEQKKGTHKGKSTTAHSINPQRRIKQYYCCCLCLARPLHLHFKTMFNIENQLLDS